MCAGGRYDGLVEQLGGKANFAAGFAMGIERLVAMLIDQQQAQAARTSDVYFAVVGDDSLKQAHKLAENLRDQLPGVELVLHAGGGSFKSQMKKADKSGASLALILGQTELEQGTVNLKYLRTDQPQQTVKQSDLVAAIARILSPAAPA